MFQTILMWHVLLTANSIGCTSDVLMSPLRLAATSTLSCFSPLRYKNSVTHVCHLTELQSSSKLNSINVAIYFLYNFWPFRPTATSPLCGVSFMFLMIQSFSVLRQGLRLFNDDTDLNSLNFTNLFLTDRTLCLRIYTATQYISLLFLKNSFTVHFLFHVYK
jgi:hypothetical protein